MTNGSSPDSGQRIGAYEVQRLLGRGGMGEVFLAWDARLRRQVAIKRVRSDRGLDAASRQRLLREARAVAGLSHSAIVHVYDLIEDAEAGDCIVMEYVEGRTLTAEIGGGLLEPARAIRLGQEIAEGLAAAHAAGIVHRDLKAENVIVTVSGHAKILDFGLARPRVLAADDLQLTQDGVLLGTFHMMSPEQASGDETDERSDLFSLGVVMYEMLTGISPFRGATPSETLKRVLFDHPARVDTVRPGLPGRLGTLIERLLAKEPGIRPANASDVAWELGEIATFLSSASIPTQTASVSDLPTVVEMPNRIASQPITRQPGAPGSTMGMSVLRRRGMKRVALALGMVIIGVLVFLEIRSLRVQKPVVGITQAPLRIVVLQPQTRGDDKKLQLAASGVLTTSLSTLTSLAGVDASPQIQLVQLAGKSATPLQLAKAAAADELLVAFLETSGNRGKITLSRRTPRGERLWEEMLTTPIESANLLQLAREVDASLLRGYPDRRMRPGTPSLKARTEDYAEFLKVKQRLDGGAVPTQEDLDQLQKIMDKSPGFLDARLLAAQVLFNRFFKSTRKIVYRDRALDIVNGTLGTAQGDPRPLLLRFRIEMSQEQPRIAAGTLKEIEALLPRDPRVLALRSNLDEKEGRLDDALAEMRAAVRASPTWLNLSSLAKLEARTGYIDDARHHIQQILAISPNNVFARDTLAWIELLFGDAHKAEQQYQDLIRSASKPERAHYTNLGVTQILLGRYEDAIQSLNKALDIDPDFADVHLNLAQAELALGRTGEAREHFQKALVEIERNSVPDNRLSYAECLAYLNRQTEAVGIISDALKQKDHDPDVLKSAALVYAVAKENHSAINYIEKALKMRVSPYWFQLPGYASLRNNPEFKRLIEGAPGARL